MFSKVFDGQVGYGSLSFFQDFPLLMYDFEWWCAVSFVFCSFRSTGGVWSLLSFEAFAMVVVWAFPLGLNDFACFSMVWPWYVALCFPCMREYIEVRATPAPF